MGRDARHSAPSQLLAQPSVSGGAPILLSGGGGRNRHLADGSGPHQTPIRPYLGTRSRGQRASQSRTAPPRHEDGDRCGQDHRDGDADRMAGGERRALPHQHQFLARLSYHRAGHHDQGSPARPAAQRHRKLLPHPRTCSRRHAGRHQQGQDRHHQLPRAPTQGDFGSQQGRAFPAPGAPRADRDQGNRRPDGSSRGGRTNGPQEHRRHQRRGPSLLSGESRTTKTSTS